MIRRIKVSALALVALAAIGAVSASAAQAGEFTAEKYPATVTGTQLSAHTFNFEGTTITCQTATFHGELPEASSELTVDAEYGECKANNGKAAVVEMTSCDYTLHATETLAMDKVDGFAEIECGTEDHIDFVIPSSGCKFEADPQTLGNWVYTDNTAAKDFDIDIASNGMLFRRNSKCPGGEGMGFAKYTGKSTMQGDFEGALDGLIVH